jgi:hypothetical protein
MHMEIIMNAIQVLNLKWWSNKNFKASNINKCLKIKNIVSIIKQIKTKRL